ncbi:uncharacterized protein LOC109860902 [Pseudomyrmex gracilis]|uniref:uncharacterized protein LOC109860902 n=1 Tax=Pseudomyrmex gracilis TaxID=219809 RepID=UPI000995D3F2|nr:uncharacterized protein LOC109860902 [Pseudomyrmex gracilis]
MTVYISESNFSRIIITLILCLQCVKICAGIEAELNLYVKGTGFHRTLIYHVNLKNFTYENCHAAIYMELPSALYVNVNEVADLTRQGIVTICSVGETDVELFAEKAGHQNVTSCASISSSSFNLTIPLHQRYHYACETSDYVKVYVPRPKLLLGCYRRIRDHRVSKINLCQPCVGLATKWREISYRILNNHNYIWLIPVGNLLFSTFVTCITLLITIIGAVFVGYAIWANTLKNRKKKN